MELLEIRRGYQRAVGTERPSMVRPAEGRLPSAFRCHQLGTAVRADIVEAADHSILAAHDQNRGVDNLDLSSDVASGFGQLTEVADLQPATSKYCGALELEIGGIVVGRSRHRLGPQPLQIR